MAQNRKATSDTAAHDPSVADAAPPPETPTPPAQDAAADAAAADAGDVDAAAADAGDVDAAAADADRPYVAAGELSEMMHELTTARAKIGELEDQLLRNLADSENLRRRFERDRAEALRYANTALAKEIFAIADSLERALATNTAGEVDPQSAYDKLWQGIGMTQTMLTEALQRAHIAKIGAIGETFDPNLHQVVSEAPPAPDTAAGTIIEVMQYGYRLHDRLLRPAMVIVAGRGQ